jgi:5-methylcytosine-specific restriction endonuclease McrA
MSLEERARHTFQQVHPCPSTGLTPGHYPGYVVDHIVPLKRGGADSANYMQWQSAAEAKAKDRVV